MTRKGWFAVVVALVLAACGDTEWRTKDISGLMPELAFELTGESGETITAQRFEGQITLVFFGFTNCPDACPTTMAALAQVLDQLPQDIASRIRVLYVSVDPDRDTPAQLAEYTDAFGERFIGATGSQEQLRELTKRYRVTYSYGDAKGQSDDYDVSHSSAVFVFDGAGEPRLMYRENRDNQAALVSDLKQLAR